MKELNKLWLFLIVGGIIALVASIGIRAYQTLSGSNESTNYAVNGIASNILMNKKTQTHIESATDF